MDFADKLHNAMEESGVYIEGEIDWRDHDFQRFRAKGHWNRKRHLFVVLLDGGASFGDWRDPSTWKTIWAKSWRDLNRDEKLARDASIARIKREQELRRNDAIYRCKLLLNHKTFRGDTCTEPSWDHPYVKTKRIIPYYARQIRSVIVLPVTDVNRNLQSLQFIKPDGFKRFKKYATPKGGMLYLAENITKDCIIRVCEGWATGCSIYEAIGVPVVVAFGAINLLNVCVQLRIKYPLNQMVICADNDQFIKENVGLKYGLDAAKQSGSKIVYPKFREKDLIHKPTDYNDLFCLQGVEEVENQLLGL